jgi:hypothetical protein
MPGIKFSCTPGVVNPPLAPPDYFTCEIYKNAVRASSLDSPQLMEVYEYVLEEPEAATYTGIWYAWYHGVKSLASAPKTIVYPQPGSSADIPVPIAQEPVYTP